MKISPARTAAFDILLRVETERAFTSVLLPQYEEGLSAADRGLCHELVLGTLRRQIWLDRNIDKLTGDKKLDIEVRISIRLGVYQLKFLDKIPHYSAINESVNLTQRAKKTSAKGFVNAVLRRTTSENVSLTYADEAERISVETSHPRWLIEKWFNDLGADDANAIAMANNEGGGTAFRVIDYDDPALNTLLNAASPSSFVDGCYLLQKPARSKGAEGATGALTSCRLPQLAEKGTIYVQDEASQMTAQSIDVPDGGQFLDVCAAPGGKTGLIARNAGKHAKVLLAGDLYWPRVQFLRENLRKQRVEGVKVVQYDAEKSLPFADGSFDSVLVDAPCSGTGTIRRNPEIRYFLSSDDLPELASKQLRILGEASKLVKPGGSLVYSTCSLEREENEDACENFLAEHADFHSVQPQVNERFITERNFARTFPHRDGMDGFFIASFKRASS